MVVTSFTIGWFGKYAVKQGLPSAAKEFGTRFERSLEALRKVPVLGRVLEALASHRQDFLGFKLYDYELPVEGEDVENPIEGPSAMPSALASALAKIAPRVSASASARPAKTPVPTLSAIDQFKKQILEVLRAAQYGEEKKGFPETEIAGFADRLKTWTKIEEQKVLDLLAAVDGLEYLPHQFLRDTNLKLMYLPQIAGMFKIGELDIERIVRGWEIKDITDAFKKGGVLEVKGLALGRPATFFFELEKKAANYARCRDLLKKIDEAVKKGSGGVTGEKVAQTYSCPDGGSYKVKEGQGVCSIHGSQAMPSRNAIPMVLYILPVEAAQKRAVGPDIDPKVPLESLQWMIKVYPHHAVAAAELGEVYNQVRNYEALFKHMLHWWPELKDNARMGFLAARGAFAEKKLDEARNYVAGALAGKFGAPPSNAPTWEDFYLIKDQAKEIEDAMAAGLAFENFTPMNRDQYPSRKCHAAMSEISVYLEGFVNGYPQSHPSLEKIEEKLAKAKQLKSKAQGAQLEKIQAMEQKLSEMKVKILGDAEKKLLWDAAVKVMVGASLTPCPSRGRFLIQPDGRLECSLHTSLFGKNIIPAKAPAPDAKATGRLGNAVRVAALEKDRGMKSCFDLQQELMASGLYKTLGAGPLPAGTVLPSGKDMACLSSGKFSIAGPERRVECTVHGASKSYFEGGAAEEKE